MLSQKNSIEMYPFLKGGGEMGELTRNYIWAESCLGNPEQWPQSLKTIVSVILNSKFPMFLWWGPDLIQFYNDAYRQSLANDGKHPTALGQKGEDCWKEIWLIIKPWIDKVFTGKESIWKEDYLIPINRNNRIEDVYWTFGYSPVYDAEGKVSGVLNICTETTEKVENLKKEIENKNQLVFEVTQQMILQQKIEEEVNQRTRELAELNVSLERKNRELEQFAYVASHDLQEPLRKVSTFTELLQGHLLNADVKAVLYFDKIKKSTARMVQLVRDILNYSQLSDERMLFQQVDLSEVVQNIISDYELLIEQKKAVIHIGKLPVIEALPSQMQQLFSNLISNALKFSKDEGAIIITITSEKLSPDLAGNIHNNLTHYLIRVHDNGIGFNQDYVHKIFTIFQRLHDKKQYEGTGIGLALCKKIIENHHGEITVDSAVNEGSQFNIILPEKQA